MDWKDILKNKFVSDALKKLELENAIKEKERKFKEFSNNVIAPAFEEIKQELIKYNRKVEFNCDERYSCIFYVMYSTGYQECTLRITPLPYINNNDCESCFISHRTFGTPNLNGFISFNMTKEELIQYFIDLYVDK